MLNDCSMKLFFTAPTRLCSESGAAFAFLFLPLPGESSFLELRPNQRNEVAKDCDADEDESDYHPPCHMKERSYVKSRCCHSYPSLPFDASQTARSSRTPSASCHLRGRQPGCRTTRPGTDTSSSRPSLLLRPRTPSTTRLGRRSR